MKIETGLFDSMVLQRNKRNMCDSDFSGTCSAAGVVVMNVSKSGRKVSGFKDRRVGKAARGRFAGRIQGLPVGGPYDVDLCIAGTGERVKIRNVAVGDVWILGGQSNMQGCGYRRNRLPSHPMVRAFYMNDRWAPGEDPIHNLWDTVDQIHLDLMGGIRPTDDHLLGVGPGVGFGQRMRELTGVPQGLLACAHGGTSMSQWNPKLKKLAGKSLYGASLRRFVKNGSKVAGVVWYQGCSDAIAEAAPLYTKRMKALIAAFRRDCRNPNLPVAVVQISRVVGWLPENAKYWNSVQDQQRRLASVIRNCTVVPAIDLALDDGIHIGSRDQHRLGRRLADAMRVLTQGRSAGLPPIAINKVSVAEEKGRGCANFVVEFSNVQGELRAESRPVGFDVVDRNGTSCVYDVVLEKNRAIVRSHLGFRDKANGALYYGYGLNPVCNVTDTGGRSLPVFGPIFKGSPRALTPYVQTLRVSAFQPSAGKLHNLKCPADLTRLGMSLRTFGQNFCDLHGEISKTAPNDIVVYYACRFECSEKMQLDVLLGYDGPIKAWVDGKELFHDPAGTNPAMAGAGRAPIVATPGEHEIIIALGSNEGKAWGVFLNFERNGVPIKLLRMGPSHYAMPKILS